MSQSTEYHSVFQKYVPHGAVAYCLDLLNHFGFRFKITRSRKTKLGDYRYLPLEKKHVVTVNHDLNPYQFLVTYLHEVAHLITFEDHQNRVKPHGKEWKKNFRDLVLPVLNPAVFPDELITTLAGYLRNPKASSCSDPGLFHALRAYDETKADETILADLSPGQVFQFNNRLFEKKNKRRTRSVCLELQTGKKYLIPELATVSIPSSEL